MQKRQLSQVKTGAVLSYVLIIANALYALIITPYVIKSLGIDEYGVYKTIGSLSTTLMVLDFGLGGTVQRFIADYLSRREEEKIPNFVATSLLFALLLNIVIILVSAIVYKLIGPLYGDSLTTTQIELGKKLFIVLTVNMLIVVIENVLNGLITGYNRFIFGNGIKLINLLIKALLIWLLLKVYNHAITIVLIGLLLTLAMLLAQVIYIKLNLKLRIHYTSWDKTIFAQAGKYTLLMFLTSIASQIFLNLDNIVIGAIRGPVLVAVYSVGLLFFGMFQQLSAGVAGVMLPTVVSVLNQENGDERVVDTVIKAGRVQFMLLGAALIGFICIGKDFVLQWLGEGYEDVYLITLILLIPSMFELCVNVCHSILRAKNKLGFRTIITYVSAVLNAVLTVILVKKWSYIGAAVATAGSYVVCSLIAMNIYYSKEIHLPMAKIYSGILGKLWICQIVAGGILFGFSRLINGSWGSIILDVLVFIISYTLLLLFFGLSDEEKAQIPIIGKRYSTA